MHSTVKLMFIFLISLVTAMPSWPYWRDMNAAWDQNRPAGRPPFNITNFAIGGRGNGSTVYSFNIQSNSRIEPSLCHKVVHTPKNDILDIDWVKCSGHGSVKFRWASHPEGGAVVTFKVAYTHLQRS